MNATKTAAVAARAPAGSAMALLEKETRWEHASTEEKAVLQRIAQQRDRLNARQAAYQQAATLRAQASSVSPEAPLVERVMTFARLHPVATAGAVGAALLFGPRRLLRVGMAVLPLLSKLRR